MEHVAAKYIYDTAQRTIRSCVFGEAALSKPIKHSCNIVAGSIAEGMGLAKVEFNGSDCWLSASVLTVEDQLWADTKANASDLKAIGARLTAGYISPIEWKLIDDVKKQLKCLC